MSAAAGFADEAGPEPGVAPVCSPCSAQCGGCQYQHLAYDDQLALKTDEIRRAVRGPDGRPDVAACVPCPAPYGYRSKLTPHFARPRPDREAAIGFLRAGQRRTHRRRRLPDRDAGRERAPDGAARGGARALGEYRRGVTLLVREASSGVTVDPRAVVTEQVGDLSLQFLAGDFFQNNPFLFPRLVAAVAEEAKTGGARFLVDAYCGSGLLGLAAAPHFERVLGVEVSPSAVAWARENAARNARASCEFIAADASAVFASVPFWGADAAVIVDRRARAAATPSSRSWPRSGHAPSSTSRAIPRRRRATSPC